MQEDFAAWAVFSGDREAMQYLGGATQPDAAWRGMATLAGSWALLGYGIISVIKKSSGEWIGRLGPWRPAGAEGNCRAQKLDGV